MPFAEEAGHAAWFFMHSMVYQVRDQGSLAAYVVAALALVERFPCEACRRKAAANQAVQAHLGRLRDMTWGPGAQDALALWAYKAHLLISATLAQTPERTRWSKLNPSTRMDPSDRQSATKALLRALAEAYAPRPPLPEGARHTMVIEL
jgi:hypothetical protein